MLTMSKVFGAASAADIAVFEQRHGLVLPDAYRQFLLRHNGGKARDAFFTVPGWQKSHVSYFYGIGLDGAYNLEDILQQVAYFFPRSLLPIGTDPGGNEICLGLSGKATGKVYFWCHEAGELSDPALTDHHPGLYLLAPDWDTFLACLEEEPPHDEDMVDS